MFQFRLDLQLLHFLFEQSEEIEEIEMTGREKKKKAGNCTQTETHTHIQYTHTNRSAHTQTHKAAEKSQRMPRHTKGGEYWGG